MSGSAVSVALTVLLAAVFGGVGIAKLLAAPPMRAAAGHLGFSVTAYRLIGALEVAAAAGVVVGLRLHWLGLLTATGIVLLMVGGVISHLRVGDRGGALVPPVLVSVAALAYGAAL